jgi:hypothetical protein
MVCDRKSVLKYTSEYVNDYKLKNQIQLKELDMWNDSFPLGDIFFLADIFHDWNSEQCIILAKKCYDSMSTGGKIILHEMLFDDEKAGPALTAAYNMKMLLWTEGQQYSFKELKIILEKVGFKNISKVNALGNWSLVVGQKY